MKINFQRWPTPAYWGGWTIAMLYNIVRDVFNGRLDHLIIFNAVHFILWAVLGLFVMPIMRRYPLRLHWRSWLFHLLLGTSMALAVIIPGHFISGRFTGVFDWISAREVVVLAVERCLHMALLNYLGFLAVVQGYDILKLARQRELQVAEHKIVSTNAQLQSLKLQLQPHFLFNTLHAIGSLMHYDVSTAERMLNRLSDMLRTSLRETDNPVVTLRQEMTFIEAYIDIEKIRFEQRLAVTWSVPEHLQSVEIPPFILQPLVENAIKYGVAPRADGGHIVIRAYSEGDALMLEVEDDGPEGTPHQKGFGIGLNNTRSRLRAMYGGAHALDLVRASGGTIARMRIPLPASELVLAAA